MRRKAIKWAREILGWESACARIPGQELEIEKERLIHSKFHSAQVYRVELSFWEPIGVAKVPTKGRASYPADPDPWVNPPPPRPHRPKEPLDPRVIQKVTDALVGKVKEAVPIRCGTWHIDEGVVWVWVDRQPSDARITLEFDPRTGGRLGAFLPFRARGSDRCAALSRPRVIQDARRRLALPEEACQVYTRLCRRGNKRLWRIRWRIGKGEWRGEVRAVVNARTSEIVEEEVRLWPRPETSVGLPGERGVAERAIRRFARRFVGRKVRIGPLVPGVVGEERKPCWLAVVACPRQGNRRITYCDGQVSVGPVQGIGQRA